MVAVGCDGGAGAHLHGSGDGAAGAATTEAKDLDHGRGSRAGEEVGAGVRCWGRTAAAPTSVLHLRIRHRRLHLLRRGAGVRKGPAHRRRTVPRTPEVEPGGTLPRGRTDAAARTGAWEGGRSEADQRGCTGSSARQTSPEIPAWARWFSAVAGVAGTVVAEEDPADRAGGERHWSIARTPTTEAVAGGSCWSGREVPDDGTAVAAGMGGADARSGAVAAGVHDAAKTQQCLRLFHESPSRRPSSCSLLRSDSRASECGPDDWPARGGNSAVRTDRGYL